MSPRPPAHVPPSLALALALAGALVLAPLRALADAPSTPSPTDGTPRGALTLFYERARKREFDHAADLLRAPGRALDAPALRAQQLYEVLLRNTVFEPEELSDRAEGSLDDGLPAGQEDVARIGSRASSSAPVLRDGPQPVRLVRLATGSWVLSRESLARITTWHDALGNRWIREHLPARLQRPSALDVALWQWLALPVGAAALFVLARLLGTLVGHGTLAFARRTKTALDNELFTALRGPRDLGLFALGAYVAMPRLELPASVEAVLERAFATLGYLALIGIGLRVLDLLAALAKDTEYVRARPVTEGFLPLGLKLAKVTVFVIAVSTVLQWLGLPVASIVASLGIGGVAVALAAKTTVENLLGALALSADRAFRPGEVVRIDDLTGVVEHIGLRSTRIRTMDRSIVAVPNGRLAELRIESLSARDRMRVAYVLVLPATAGVAVVREALRRVEEAVRAQPLTIQDDVGVWLRELSPVGITLEVTAWLSTQDPKLFASGRQEMLLDVLGAVEAAGTTLVAPAQWVVSQAAPKV